MKYIVGHLTGSQSGIRQLPGDRLGGEGWTGFLHSLPLGTIKNKKGLNLNTPPLWETSRAQQCQAKRYSWAMKQHDSTRIISGIRRR